MRRMLYALPCILVALLSSLSVFPVIHAKPLTTISCERSGGGDCVTEQQWGQVSGTAYAQHGAISIYTIANPTLPDSTDYWDRWLEINDVHNGGSDYALVGVEKSGSSGGYYCISGSLYFFIDVVISGTSYIDCGLISNGLINTQDKFQCSFYSSGGGGVFCEIGTNCPSSCDYGPYFFSGAAQTYTSIVLGEQIYDDTISSHVVWGAEWYSNEYQSTVSPNNWYYQPSACAGGTPGDDNDNCIVRDTNNDPAPQMHWHTDPNGSTNLGGTMYSCVYNSTVNNSCTYGS